MSSFQLLVYELTLDSLMKRSLIWKDYEDNNISLSSAREKNKFVEKNMDIKIQEKYAGNKHE